MDTIRALILITILQFLLVGCNSSKPDQDTIEKAAVNLFNPIPAEYSTLKQPYVTNDFKITNKFTKNVNNETYFIYETEFKLKEKETGNIVDASQTQTDDGLVRLTFGLVKRGDKWYPIR